MLNAQTLEWLMTCERLKDEAVNLERQAEGILARFDGLERDATIAERDARRNAYLDNRARLDEINGRIETINAQIRLR